MDFLGPMSILGSKKIQITDILADLNFYIKKKKKINIKQIAAFDPLNKVQTLVTKVKIEGRTFKYFQILL